MQILERHLSSPTGHRVFRRTLLPDQPVRSGVLVIHGLGDHISRHDRHLAAFVRRGVACCGIDLPGHGRSDGPRGHIDRMQTILTLLDETVTHLRTLLPPGAPIGIVGHSMGGFLGLYYLTERPGVFDYAWISSPLIDARRHGNLVLRSLIHLAGFLWPTLTIRSRVRTQWCKRDPEAIAETLSDPLVHRCISASLLRMLLRAAPKLLRGRLAGNLELLMTHGGQDRICPPKWSKKFFQQLPLAKKRYCHFADLLHEPFNDLGKEHLLRELDRWLDELFADEPASEPVLLRPV